MLKLTLPRVLLCLLLISSLGLWVPGAMAQSTTDGAIGGTVFDPNGAVVPNATVSVRNNATNIEQTVTTDSSGYYRAGKLQPSTYTVTVTAQGFSPFKAERVIVQVGLLTDLAAHLTIGGAGENIIVSAESPQINTTSADFAPVLNQIAIENLPINGGRWSNFALLTPGVVNDANGFGLLSFRGISTLLNNNTVDGADNNQAFFSEERGRTRAGYSTAKVAVQEFQVNTSNYSAEYGRAAGGVTNTVTKSGGNQIHGEAYFYDRDNDWGAYNPYTTITTQSAPGVYTSVPYKPKDWRKMWGLGIGGPIIKDKLFWFFAYDQYKRNFPGTGVATSPSAFFATPSASTISTLATRLGVTNAVAQADYNNGLSAMLGELGPVARTGDQTIFFPKIDWQINNKNHASLSVNRMRWGSPAGIQTQATNTYAIDSFGNDYVRDTWGVGKLDSFITDRISNEVRFQYGRDLEFENPQSPTQYELSNFINRPGYTNPLGLAPQITVTNGFNMGVPSFLTRPKYPDERREQLADTVTWQRGKHTLKFGEDISQVSDTSQNLRYQYGGYSYTSLLNYFSDLYNPGHCTVTGKTGLYPCYSSYNQSFGPLGFSFRTYDYAFFGQDDWKITPRFTLNVGLRYEYEQLPRVYQNLINPAVPQTAQMPSDKNNLGPRIGFAWDIFGNGKTSVRGGYGLYYGRIINSTIYSALTTTGMPGSQLQYTFTQTAAGAPAFPQILGTTPTASIKPNLVFFDSHFQNPQIYEADLTIEREVGWNTVVSASYLGSFGRELPSFGDINLGSPVATTYTINGGGPLTGGTYTTNVYTKRPNAAFGSMTDIYSGVNSSYNALAVQLNHRMNRHVQFSTNYTWSHALDYGVNGSTFTDTNDLLQPGNARAEYGNSNYDVRHRVTLNIVGESPWHVNGWAGWAVNGWQIAPVFQWQTGLPYSIVTSGSAPGGVSSGLYGTGGNFTGIGNGVDILGRNTLRYPNTQVVDLRLSKFFTFNEKYNLELSGDAFNLLNHVNVTGINNTAYIISGTNLNFNTGAYGGVTSANSNWAYSPRQIQVGARFRF